MNENGQLSTKELKYAMRMLGLNPTEHRVQELVNDLDYEGENIRNTGASAEFYSRLKLFHCFSKTEKNKKIKTALNA